MLTIENTNALVEKIKANGNIPKLERLMTINAGKLPSDKFLSFDEVCSIELSEEQEKAVGYHWIDGVQLMVYRGGVKEVVIWVSSYQSEEIFSVGPMEIPKELYPELFNKVMNAFEKIGTLCVV